MHSQLSWPLRFAHKYDPFFGPHKISIYLYIIIIYLLVCLQVVRLELEYFVA